MSRLGGRAGARLRKRRKRLKPFLPLIIIGNVISLADKMDEFGPLMKMQQEYQSGNIIFSTEIWLNNLTALCSALRLSGQTESADRALTVKEEDHRAG